MGDKSSVEHATQRREELKTRLGNKKNWRSEEAEENAYYKKADQFLKAIRSGNLEKVQAYLAETTWNKTYDPLIYYRIDKRDYSSLAPEWEQKHTTVLNEAVLAKQLNIISYVVRQPEFHTNDVELLGKIGALAIEQGDKDLINKVLQVRKVVPESHIIAAEKWKREMAERGRG